MLKRKQAHDIWVSLRRTIPHLLSPSSGHKYNLPHIINQTDTSILPTYAGRLFLVRGPWKTTEPTSRKSFLLEYFSSLFVFTLLRDNSGWKLSGSHRLYFTGLLIETISKPSHIYFSRSIVTFVWIYFRRRRSTTFPCLLSLIYYIKNAIEQISMSNPAVTQLGSPGTPTYSASVLHTTNQLCYSYIK
jgi:hypothetical protein